MERYNQFTGKRHDLFGIIDIIAMGNGHICGVQSCGSGFAEHKRTILESDKALDWIANKGKLLLVAWRKVKKKRGGKAMIWVPRIYEFTLDDFTRKEGYNY